MINESQDSSSAFVQFNLEINIGNDSIIYGKLHKNDNIN